jgi:hypothetical protein
MTPDPNAESVSPSADLVRVIAQELCPGDGEHFRTEWPCQRCWDAARRVAVHRDEILAALSSNDRSGPDVMGDYQAAGWQIDHDGAWHEPEPD